MRMKRAYGVLAVVTLALLFGERVEAQLAKMVVVINRASA